MKLSIIVAFDEARCMGTDTGLPWLIPEEMAHFKRTTWGYPVIMGRRTWELLPAKYRPLPGRKNIVLTKQTLSLCSACVASSLDGVLRLAIDAEEAFVIGGLQVYRVALPVTERILVSQIHGRFQGTFTFPELLGWTGRLVSQHEQFDVWEYIHD